MQVRFLPLTASVGCAYSLLTLTIKGQARIQIAQPTFQCRRSEVDMGITLCCNEIELHETPTHVTVKAVHRLGEYGWVGCLGVYLSWYTRCVAYDEVARVADTHVTAVLDAIRKHKRLTFTWKMSHMSLNLWCKEVELRQTPTVLTIAAMECLEKSGWTGVLTVYLTWYLKTAETEVAAQHVFAICAAIREHGKLTFGYE